MANPLIVLTLTHEEAKSLLSVLIHTTVNGGLFEDEKAIADMLDGLVDMAPTSMAVLRKHGTTPDAAAVMASVEDWARECETHWSWSSREEALSEREAAHLEALHTDAELDAERERMEGYTKPQSWTLGDILAPQTPDDEPSGSDYDASCIIAPEGLR